MSYDDPSPTDETLPPRHAEPPPAAREPEPGDTIGRYRIGAVLGRGAMGVVYRAHATHLGRDVALKVVSGAYAGVREARSRFNREARAAARAADHPGVAGVHDLGEVNGLPYLAMELVEGPTLRECVDVEQFDDRGYVQLVAEAARAVHHAHAQGVLHRDLKPGNILVAPGTGQGPAGPRAKVTDFGLASFALTGMQITRLTVEGRAVGTPAFMPPEQARGGACDARSDVYGLGATLYHCLAGRPPVDAETVPEIVERVVEGDHLPLTQARPGCDAALGAVVERALATDPADRYPTAAALADDLDRWLAGTGVEASAPRSPAPARRPPLAWIAAAAAAGALVPALWWAASRSTEDEAVEEAAARRTAAERLADRTQAFAAVAQRTASHLELLEDFFHGAPVPAADRAAAVAAIEQIAARMEDGGPAAWIAFARWLASAGKVGLGPLEAAVADVPGDPRPRSLLVRARALHYVRVLPHPAFHLTAQGVEVTPAEVVPAAEQAREALIAALTEWRARGGAGGSDAGSAMVAFATGAEALAAGNLERAADVLAPLADDRFIGLEAALLHGYALQFAGRYGRAAQVFEPLAERGWESGLGMAARARLFDAVERLAAGERPLAAFQRAEARLQAWADARPDLALPYLLQGSQWELRANLLTSLGETPDTALRQAAAAYQAAADRVSGPSATQVGLVRVHLAIAHWLGGGGKDPAAAEEHVLRAIAIADAVREGKRQPRGLRRQLADAHFLLSVLRFKRTADPRPHAKAARALYEAEVRRLTDARETPGVDVYIALGRTYEFEVRQDVRESKPTLPNIQSSAVWFEQAVMREPGLREGWERLAVAKNQIGLELRRREQPKEAAAAYLRAIECREEMLQRFPDVERVRTLWTLGGAHVNRGLALDAAGLDGRPEFTTGLARLQEAASLAPNDATVQRYLAGSYHGRAERDLKRDRTDTVRADLTAAVAAYERAIALAPGLERALAPALGSARAALARAR